MFAIFLYMLYFFLESITKNSDRWDVFVETIQKQFQFSCMERKLAQY